MDQRQIFLRDVLSVVFSRKKTIVFFAAAVIILTLAGNMVWPRTYESTAKVQIKRGRETVGVDESVLKGVSMPVVQMTEYDVNTNIGLFFSNDVLRKVVENTQLDPAKTGGLGYILRGGLNAVQVALRFRSRTVDKVQEAADELARAITVEPVKDSYVLEIRCGLGSADLSHQVLKELINQFRIKHKQVYSTGSLIKFFEKEVEQVHKTLLEAQTKQREFRALNKIVALETERDQLVEQYSSTQRLLNQLVDTQAATSETASEEEMTSILSRKTESTVVTEIQLRLLEKIMEKKRAETQNGPQHPKVLGLIQELDGLKAQLKESIETTRATAEASKKSLEESITKANNQMGDLDNLDREVKLRGDSYEYYSEKLSEAKAYAAMADYSGSSEEEDISSIAVISSPILPENPISPQQFVNLILAIIAGVVGGLAIAFFLDYLDHSIKTPEDAEYYLKCPVLASSFAGPDKPFSPQQAERINSMVQGLLDGKGAQLIMVTSSVRGEGANRVAMALAEAEADDPNTKGLIIDFTENAVTDANPACGVLDVVRGDCSLSDAIVEKGGLDRMSCGTQRSCPAYLWTSERMAAMFESLRQEYDSIVVHVAPILNSHDALHMARHADGIILVVKSNATRREVVLSAIEALHNNKNKTLGSVLVNRVQVIPKFVYNWI